MPYKNLDKEGTQVAYLELPVDNHMPGTASLQGGQLVNHQDGQT